MRSRPTSRSRGFHILGRRGLLYQVPAEIMEKHGTGSDSDTALLYLAAIFKTTIHAVCSAAVSTTFDMQLSWLATVRYQVIDTKKAMDLGIDLELAGSRKVWAEFLIVWFGWYISVDVNASQVQSSDREDNIYVRGSVPAEILSSCQPNIPANLPDTLKAKIVDPKSFEDVPIIDLSGDEAGLVEQIRYACEASRIGCLLKALLRVVGFMQVTGHGISEELQDLQKKFFELPQSVKERLKLCDESSPVRGYFGLGGEDLDQVLEKQVDEANGKDTIRKARKDLKEAVYFTFIGRFMLKHLCKEELAGFREVATHRLLHYWPLKDYETEIGVGEHTDYGLLTVLKQDLVGGLQVKNAFVINLGDMLSRWLEEG
ncbi:Gibberellin 2-beta-dioxygenase 4 [Symbiodinium microadriaticum]|uniref:Gibberellin 2-beta-dioxygenase 4 n=1 Tax=Symbiodinium microadriaticum TaxID=2951 RepID=A0A1Q9DPY3_SYMMI|nr:Gibberellin 2-beta-dioxygenase 4 [Symbiodinium microadriaticum]